MFNSPILDVAIGLVFIFLLYSLLATSVKETIATVFAFRARMLKNAITDSMLSCKEKETARSRWASIARGIGEFFQECLFIITGNLKTRKNNLGTYFYDHPIIKSYGASRVFPNPSYIPDNDFSTILIDLLKRDFSDKLPDIAAWKITRQPGSEQLTDVLRDLAAAADMIKIKTLLDYYGYHFTVLERAPARFSIDKETWYLLQLHLEKALYSLNGFAAELEKWFNQTMDRVSGWYKRQVQVILFFLGLAMAVMFNVDTIAIVDRLSNDKDARNQLVQMAIQSADKYKDDPRVKKSEGNAALSAADSVRNAELFSQYQAKADSARQLLNQQISSANSIIALGYDDYGRSDNSFRRYLGPRDADSAASAAYYENHLKAHPARTKLAYVWFTVSSQPKKVLGFFITAFAICLGAPFWFDLLNKLIRMRGAGKKEDDNPRAKKKSGTVSQPPITVNIQNPTTGEDAVG